MSFQGIIRPKNCLRNWKGKHMAQFKFKSDDRDEIRSERKTTMKQENTSPATDFMSFCVRLMGMFMLIAGLWLGVKLIVEVWALYKAPQNIERLADYIEKGSHLDKALGSFSSKRPQRVKEKEGLLDEPVATSKKADDESLRITYFIAWIIAIFLLMLIGRLALGAIKTGGELALYDLQVKRFARLLIEEVRDPDKKHK